MTHEKKHLKEQVKGQCQGQCRQTETGGNEKEHRRSIELQPQPPQKELAQRNYYKELHAYRLHEPRLALAKYIFDNLFKTFIHHN